MANAKLKNALMTIGNKKGYGLTVKSESSSDDWDANSEGSDGSYLKQI